MSPKQRAVVLVGLLGVALMGLFPPVVSTSERNYAGGHGGVLTTVSPDGYGFLFLPPSGWMGPPSNSDHRRFDLPRLTIQWVTWAALMAAAFVLLSNEARQASESRRV